MKAYLRSVRIAPKKIALIASMIRGMTVTDALKSLEHTNKKGARILLTLVESAVANARHNERQDPAALVVRSLVINKAQTLHRGVPMARGRVRPMRKFLSHVELVLGVEGVEETKPAKKDASKKVEKKTSASAAKTVQKPSTGTKRASSKPAKAKEETTASDSSSSRA